MQAANFIQGGDETIAARTEDIAHLRHAALIARERGDGGGLRDAGRVGSALRLQFLHGADQPGGSRRVAEAPAGHGVGLGDTVHHQAAIAQRGRGHDDICEFHFAIKQVFIDVVGYDEDVLVRREHVGERRKFSACIDGARRVVRTVQDEQPGPWTDCLLQLFGGELEAAFDRAGQCPRPGLGELGDRRVGNPVGRRHQDFVARIEQCQAGAVERVLGAAGRDDFRGCIVESVLARELCDYRALECRRAVNRRVMRLAGGKRRRGGLADEFGRREIGFAYGEIEHVAPGCGEFLGACADC